MAGPEFVDPSDLRPGPIRHESLPDELLGQIRSIYDLIGPYLDTTLEQYEINFMRDMHPQSEVMVWASITAAWLDYHRLHLNQERLPDDDEKKLISALILISMGVKDVDKLGVSAEVGSELLDCYDSLGE